MLWIELMPEEQAVRWQERARRWRVCACERRRDTRGLERNLIATGHHNVELQRTIEQLEAQVAALQAEVAVLHDEAEALWKQRGAT